MTKWIKAKIRFDILTNRTDFNHIGYAKGYMTPGKKVLVRKANEDDEAYNMKETFVDQRFYYDASWLIFTKRYANEEEI